MGPGAGEEPNAPDRVAVGRLLTRNPGRTTITPRKREATGELCYEKSSPTHGGSPRHRYGKEGLNVKRTPVFAIMAMVVILLIAVGCSANRGSEPTSVAAAPTNTRGLRVTAVTSPTGTGTALPATSASPARVEATPTFSGESPMEPSKATPAFGTAQVNTIEVSVTNSVPPKAAVTVRGVFPDGCTRISRVSQARNGSTILVEVLTERFAHQDCAQTSVPFEETIALDVAGLPAGTYSVDVNGVTGTLTLAEETISPTETTSPEDRAGVCPEPGEGQAGYSNDMDGYCFLYPEEYEAREPSPGAVIIARPEGREGPQGPAVSFAVKREGTAQGLSAEDIADAYVSQLGEGEKGISRSTILLGGERGVVLDSVPGETLTRQAFVVHEDRVFVLSLSPVDTRYSQATKLAEDLWLVVSSSWTFFEARPPERDREYSYEGWTLHEFDDLGVRLYTPPDWVLTDEKGRHGLAPQGSDNPYLLSFDIVSDVPEAVRDDMDALVDFLAQRLRAEGQSNFVVRSVVYGEFDGVEFSRRADVCAETYIPAYDQVVRITLASGGCDAEGEIAVAEYPAVVASLEFYAPAP